MAPPAGGDGGRGIPRTGERRSIGNSCPAVKKIFSKNVMTGFLIV